MISSSLNKKKRREFIKAQKYLEETCEQTIRRMVTAALKARPTDMLDFIARWISKERGVTMAEVETDVMEFVRERGAFDAAYRLPEKSEEEYGDEVDSKGNPVKNRNIDIGDQLSGDEEQHNSENNSVEKEVVYSDDEGDLGDEIAVEERIRRRVVNSLTFKTLDEETREIVISGMHEMKVK